MKSLGYALLILLTGSTAVAADDGRGERLFADHCAVCHGLEARGDGPMASILSVAPADLTMLSVANEGVFPTDRIVRRIDGTTEVLAHGGPMPIFGVLLEGPSDVVLAPDGSEIIASESIVEITTWLQGIQEDN